MSKSELKLEAIKGHAGDQLEIEGILNKGGALAEYQLKALPDCPQRLKYARRSYQNVMKGESFHSATDMVEFFPEDEMAACIEEIFQKSMFANRTQWAEYAAKKFPCSNKWNSRRVELLEIVIRKHLDAGCANWAQETAKKIPRKLTSLELEAVISRHLGDSFHFAETAVGIAGRTFTVDELRIAAEGARENKNWELLLKISQMFPPANREEQELLVNEAHKAFLTRRDSDGINSVCKIQGNRKMKTSELKLIFEKECLDSGIMRNSFSHYAKELAKDPTNTSYLEKKAVEFISKQAENALDIALVLSETSDERVRIIEEVGKIALSRRQERLIKKCAAALPTENKICNKLAQYLVSAIMVKVAEFELIKRGEDVLLALEVVKLLPKGKEKIEHLKKLYAASKKIEDGLDRRDDLSPSGFYEVKAMLNDCA